MKTRDGKPPSPKGPDPALGHSIGASPDNQTINPADRYSVSHGSTKRVTIPGQERDDDIEAIEEERARQTAKEVLEEKAEEGVERLYETLTRGIRSV